MKAGAPLKFLQSVVGSWSFGGNSQRNAARNSDIYVPLSREYSQHVYQGEKLLETLLWAARYGHVQQLNRLLREETDVALRVNTPELLCDATPLHWAAFHGHAPAVDYLCSVGADSNSRDKYQCTPLHLAAFNAHKEVVYLLCKYGADVHAKNQIGDTPLHISGRGKSAGAIDAMVALLEHGASLSAKNDDGHVVFSRIYQRLYGAQFVHFVEKALEAGADLLHLDDETIAPEHWQLLFHNAPMDSHTIFLLGDGGMGKTALKGSLKTAREADHPLEFEDDPEDTSTRTLGVEYETMVLCSDGIPRARFDDLKATDAMRVRLQDFGGQRSYQMVHDMFFHGAYAIYAILLRVDRLTAFAAVDRLNYWLQFLNSCGRAGDVVIILSGHMGKREAAVRKALQEFLKYNFSEHVLSMDRTTGEVATAPLLHEGLRLHMEMVALDCRKSNSAQMKALRKLFYRIFRDMEEEFQLQMPAACVVLRNFVEYRRALLRARQQSPFLTVQALLQDVKKRLPGLRDISEKILLKLCGYLEACGEVVTLPSYILIDPNVLTSDLIGRLFEPQYLPSRRPILSVREVERITRGSRYFGDAQDVPNLLESIGLCISSEEPELKFFPCFKQEELDDRGYPVDTRAKPWVGRRFRLKDGSYRAYFPGYFPRLFSMIAQKVRTRQLGEHPRITIWKNAILLQDIKAYYLNDSSIVPRRSESTLEIFVEHDRKEFVTAFDLIVSSTPWDAMLVEGWVEELRAVTRSFTLQHSNLLLTSNAVGKSEVMLPFNEREVVPGDTALQARTHRARRTSTDDATRKPRAKRSADTEPKNASTDRNSVERRRSEPAVPVVAKPQCEAGGGEEQMRRHSFVL